MLSEKQKELIKTTLTNDENSTDEELIQYFMNELKISRIEAKSIVDKRDYYSEKIIPDIFYKDKFKSELDRIRSGKTNPENKAYYVLAEDNQVVIVIEGEKGYHLTEWKWNNVNWKAAQELAKIKNLSMGISPELAEAIIVYSMFPNK